MSRTSHAGSHSVWIETAAAILLCIGLGMAAVTLGRAAEPHQTAAAGTSAVSDVTALPLYDETSYYNAVKNRWFGLGDYATDRPGR
jgi:hypothetical protein